VIPRNHKGAREFPDAISAYLKKEKHYGAILGPFDESPFLSAPLALSPLNSVPKSDGSRRIILDLSFPEGAGAVNDGIYKKQFLGQPISLHYPTVDDLVELVKGKGRGCFLFKRDLHRYYRQIPVCPGDINLLSYCWEGHIFVDRVLPMGLRTACFIGQRITNSVAFMLEQAGFKVLNYLDDFAGCEKDETTAIKAHQCVGDTLRLTGLKESCEKEVGPSTRMEFLGVLFDTVLLELQITPARLKEIDKILQIWLSKEDATRVEVESLLGKLNFVARCVHQSRIFMCRMLNFLRGMPRKGDFKLDLDFKQDVWWWSVFMKKYSGVSVMMLEDWSAPDTTFASDACLHGCGGVSQNQFFHAKFPQFIVDQELHINALEFLTVVVAVKLWGCLWKGKKILIYCDNLATVISLNSGRSRDGFLQSCLREVAFLAACGEFVVRAVHLPGVENRLPDLLSRWDSHVHRSQFQVANQKLALSEVSVPDRFFYFINEW
jgi:hypothetical protein